MGAGLFIFGEELFLKRGEVVQVSFDGLWVPEAGESHSIFKEIILILR